MSIQKIPVFKPGMILTHEMLDVLKEYAIENAEAEYRGYSDGVLKGCQITAAPGVVCVGEGIVILKSHPFYFRKKITLETEPCDEVRVLAVRASEEENGPDFVMREITVFLAPEEDLLAGDVELCRFRLQPGAELRCRYKDYRDMSAEYDTVCMKYAKWASYKRTSAAFPLLEQFAKEARAEAGCKELDRQFLLRIAASDGRTLNAEEIDLYLSWRLDRPYRERTSGEQYDELGEALCRIKSRQSRTAPGRTPARKMIVD